MAKTNRQIFLFQCSVCKSRNHNGSKNTVNIKEKLTLSKYCNQCRKSSPHNEIKL